MAQQIDLEVAVLNDRLSTLASALAIIAEDESPASLDPAAEGRASIRILRINKLTALAALINTGFRPAQVAA